MTGLLSFFFLTDTAATDIYTLSLHELFRSPRQRGQRPRGVTPGGVALDRGVFTISLDFELIWGTLDRGVDTFRDRKSTRLNSSHLVTSYAVYCLKKNNTLYGEPICLH